jgi:hypothetical protein
LQRHTDRIGKLRGGEARKQTEPPDNALKKHAALLCWQVASGSHDGGKLGIAEGEHLAAESLVAHPALWWVLCLTAVKVSAYRPPIFLRLAFHRWRIRILDLHPTRRTAEAITTKPARLAEDYRAILVPQALDAFGVTTDCLRSRPISGQARAS